MSVIAAHCFIYMLSMGNWKLGDGYYTCKGDFIATGMNAKIYTIYVTQYSLPLKVLAFNWQVIDKRIPKISTTLNKMMTLFFGKMLMLFFLNFFKMFEMGFFLILILKKVCYGVLQSHHCFLNVLECLNMLEFSRMIYNVL